MSQFRAFKNYVADLQKHFNNVIVLQIQNITNHITLIEAQAQVNAMLTSFEAFTLKRNGSRCNHGMPLPGIWGAGRGAVGMVVGPERTGS